MEFGNSVVFQMRSWKKKPHFPTSVLVATAQWSPVGSLFNSLQNGLIYPFWYRRKEKNFLKIVAILSLPLSVRLVLFDNI